MIEVELRRLGQVSFALALGDALVGAVAEHSHHPQQRARSGFPALV